ncbi:MAG: hypothetical protein Q4F01_05885 [Staphylococcus rostri]|uniref:hypothetical protein n=1 Tax=Staphylococcus rostri TaxID=522262 RepID=UPI0026E06BE1|nr:hypothetical protein [Staphylococcus rostri]MDO5375704.1 hypothetical protein [Staphylococcus rostri]
MDIKQMLKTAELLTTTILFAISVYELYIRITSEDEIDEPFSSFDQIDLDGFRPEVSD